MKIKHFKNESGIVVDVLTSKLMYFALKQSRECSEMMERNWSIQLVSQDSFFVFIAK